jgi:hypothetical protein
MSYRKLYYPVNILAVLSFVAIAIEYWSAGVIGLALLLAPYLALYFLSSDDNYRSFKLAIIRVIPAVVTFLFVPWLLFGIESDPQASIGLMFWVMIQLSLISLAELIILFFLKGESRT